MKIHVHIERLVLDSLPVGRGDGRVIDAAVRRELGTLLAGSGLSREFRQGTAIPVLRAGALRFQPGARPAALGRAVAQEVHRAIGVDK